MAGFMLAACVPERIATKTDLPFEKNWNVRSSRLFSICAFLCLETASVYVWINEKRARHQKRFSVVFCAQWEAYFYHLMIQTFPVHQFQSRTIFHQWLAMPLICDENPSAPPCKSLWLHSRGGFRHPRGLRQRRKLVFLGPFFRKPPPPLTSPVWDQNSRQPFSLALCHSRHFDECLVAINGDRLPPYCLKPMGWIHLRKQQWLLWVWNWLCLLLLFFGVIFPSVA